MRRSEHRNGAYDETISPLMLEEDPESFTSSLEYPPPVNASSSPSSHHHPPDALPGRPRRRQPQSSRGRGGETTLQKRRKKRSGAGNSQNKKTSSPPLLKNPRVRILLAIILWYLLGVVSIGTSKLLLTSSSDGDDDATYRGWYGGVRPLVLSVQQFAIGSALLRLVLRYGLFGSNGVQSVESGKPNDKYDANTEIMLCGIFFCSGFVATNYSFHGSAPSFVETVKAAEPLTSAGVAVLWKLEILGFNEALSLLGIVVGVFISTISNSSVHAHHRGRNALYESFMSCFIVMVSNLCFSFRGLRQKILRSLPNGKHDKIDDINLQFRMQQMGMFIFLIPALIYELPDAISNMWNLSRDYGLIPSGILLRYIILSLVNGIAFTSYNLASTYILTRISVVHHAALNCLRRVFAIVVTSVAFGVPITILGTFGIVLSIIGFLSFTHFKLKRQREPRPLSSLLPMSVL
mmetsp:Transcript_52197/g.62838  ORF Transcript_52197/g.62838 Transcript_52197/m.62838 type:complete len:463 (+) Transcript_52197:122-1510(+)